MGRLFASLPFALVITGAVFLIIVSLIRQPDVPQETPKDPPVETVLIEKKPPPKPDDPDEVPTKEKATLPTNPSPVKPRPTTRPTIPNPTSIGGPDATLVLGGKLPGPSDIVGVPLITAAPSYPASCQARGVEGEAIVEFDILGSGQVVNAQIVSSTDKCFERAAIRAIEAWQYQPVIGREGEVVLEGQRRTFTFELKDE